MERPEILKYDRKSRIFGTEESHQMLEAIYDKAFDRYQEYSNAETYENDALLFAYILLTSEMEAYINATAEGVKV